MKPRFRNLNLILVRKTPKRVRSETDVVCDYTDEETYQQSLMLRRLAKKITGSPFIRLD